MEPVKYGARLKFWAWLFVALFILLISKTGYAQATNGLNYTTYQPAGSGPWASPNRSTLTPLTSGTIANLYTDWDVVLDSGRNQGVVVKFTGFFQAGTAGTYNFGLEGDDGVELIMKGQTLISHWADQPGTRRTATITLTAGEIVPVTIWYYENGGGARLRFIQEVSGVWQAVPTTSLATSSTLWAPSSCNPCTPNTNNPNLGFESGTTANWIISNGTGTSKTSGWSSNGEGVQTSTGMSSYSPGGGKTWSVTPYGNHMMVIQAGSGSPNFDPAMTSLGMTATEIQQIRSYLTSLGGNSTPTNASWAKREVYLQAGITYTIAWQYMSTDYVPFNDGSAMTLTHITDASRIPTLNNEVKRYALLGFTNPGTGNYATNSYGATGWQLATITVPVDGNYVLGFASFNLGDTALSPILLIDDLQGSTTLNGQNFGPIAPNAGSNAPSAGSVSGPSCPNSSTCSTTSFTANTGFNNRATVWSQQTGNRVIIEQVGNFNAATVTQSGNKNYVEVDLLGSNNTTTVTQSTTAVTASNYIEALITGNSNTINLTQNGAGGNKGIMAIVNNNANSLTVNQTGTGNHYAEINLAGSNKSADLTQSGSVGHMAKIELTGGATTITTIQQGSTQQFYSITHNCAQTSCAAISVTQGQ